MFNFHSHSPQSTLIDEQHFIVEQTILQKKQITTVSRNRNNYFLFGLVFIKKIIKLNFFLNNQNRFKPTDFGSVQFCFLEQKLVQTGLTRFFCFGSVFPDLTRFFPI
jgi:hypothetical protein